MLYLEFCKTKISEFIVQARAKLVFSKCSFAWFRYVLKYNYYTNIATLISSQTTYLLSSIKNTNHFSYSFSLSLFITKTLCCIYFFAASTYKTITNRNIITHFKTKEFVTGIYQ